MKREVNLNQEFHLLKWEGYKVNVSVDFLQKPDATAMYP